MKEQIKLEIQRHIEVSKKMHGLIDQIEEAAKLCISAISSQKKILICGNGGSAADAQHIAAELVGRFKNERKGIPALALSTDTSALTSISNDYGYEFVFQRQVEALANPGDVIIGISTGGTSLNVINAMKLALSMGCIGIGLSGKDGGDMNKICDLNLIIPETDTPRIQEMHILVGHLICQSIDENLSN